MSGCGRTLFWIGFTERTISNLKLSTHNICSKLSTLVVPRQNGPCQEKNRLFYDFLPESTTFVLWRTAKTWMQPSTKTKDTFEPSNETVFDKKTVHGRKQMHKWECKAAGRAFWGTTSQSRLRLANLFSKGERSFVQPLRRFAPAPLVGEPLAGRVSPAVRIGPIGRKAAGPVRMGSSCGTAP